MAQGPAGLASDTGSAALASFDIGAPLAGVFRNLLMSDFDDVVRREAELRQQALDRRRSAEGVHSNHRTATAHITLPTDHRALLDRDPRVDRVRQHLFA